MDRHLSTLYREARRIERELEASRAALQTGALEIALVAVLAAIPAFKAAQITIQTRRALVRAVKTGRSLANTDALNIFMAITSVNAAIVGLATLADAHHSIRDAERRARILKRKMQTVENELAILRHRYSYRGCAGIKELAKA